VHSAQFLRTRVARRMLLLFLLCAMVPLAALAVLGYRSVASHLVDAPVERLRAETKSAGMVLLDRLTVLSALFESLGEGIVPSHPAGRVRLAGAVRASFAALAIVDSNRDVVPLKGDIGPVPPLGPAQEAHMARGKTTLVTASAPERARVYLVRELPGHRARLWGLLEPDALGASETGPGIAPPGTLLCVTDQLERPLVCAGAPPHPESGPTGTLRWVDRGVPYAATRWALFLGPTYAAPPWTITLSVPEAQLTAPLRDLRHTIAFGLIFALAVVFALTHIYLRQSTRPLEALEAGTRRVAEGRFDEPVIVESRDEFASLAASFNRMAGQLGVQFRVRDALQRIHGTALRGEGLPRVVEEIFHGRADLLRGTALSVALAEPDGTTWRAAHDDGTGAERHAPITVVPDLRELEELKAGSSGFVVRRGEGARSYFPRPGTRLVHDALVLPLMRHGALSGAVTIQCDASQETDPEALATARRGTDQVAAALANAQLTEELDAIHWGALTALARTIDAVSPWTAGHSERVTMGAVEIGQWLGLRPADIELLHRGGLLHDIGKVGIPVTTLDKPGKLTEEEMAVIRTHPEIGARILAPVAAFHRAIPLVLHHHEQLDGTGYPNGLAGDQIPELVRILTVADVFDALTSERPYRPAWSLDRAIAYLQENAGTKFDPAAVEALAGAVANGWRLSASTIDLYRNVPVDLRHRSRRAPVGSGTATPAPAPS
jgi:putative nucleotidyltransferase with HDIG domain